MNKLLLPFLAFTIGTTALQAQNLEAVVKPDTQYVFPWGGDDPNKTLGIKILSNVSPEEYIFQMHIPQRSSNCPAAMIAFPISKDPVEFYVKSDPEGISQMALFEMSSTGPLEMYFIQLDSCDGNPPNIYGNWEDTEIKAYYDLVTGKQ